MNETYDTAVIGGGPAGSSAAINLASRGMKVVLFEARAYPHHKVCGEFLSPECAGLLDTLGMTSSLADLDPVPIGVACLTASDGTVWETTLPGTALGLSRAALDHALARQARLVGVDVREATPITGLAGNLRDGFEILTRHSSGTIRARARTVISAHGKRSHVDRALRRRFLDQEQPYVALKAHFHGPPLPGRIELHAFPGGYCGMSEIEGGATNVCLLVQQEVFRNAAAGARPIEVATFIQWMRAQNPWLNERLRQAEPIGERWLSIGQVPFVDKRPVVGDVLMTGDAAGLIAPLAGDGIGMALHGGMIAAGHVARYLAGEIPADALSREYTIAWRSTFGTRLRLARLLQSLIFRPRIAAMVLRGINILPWVGQLLVRQTRDMRLIKQGVALL